MAIENRTVSIKNVFASTANTSIPNPPASGVSYRNTSTTAAEIGEGWPYKEIVDSAKFNEAMYEYTTICQQLEKYGFLPWSANTDYLAGGCALGTDGNIYQAKVNTGPGSTALDPVSDTSHTIWDLFYYSTFTANRALVSNGSGKVAASSVTATELSYLSGVTSPIQTQINNKAANNAVVHIAGTETITGAKTFSNTITGSISGNAATVTNGVYTTGNQTIGGTKTFSNTIHGSINGNAATVTNGVYTTGNQTIGGTKTFSTTPVVGTKGNSDSTTSAASTAYVKNILAALYPVGSIYIGTQDTCPLATLIPNSTWSKISGDRVLQSSSSNHSANTTISAGLPNITGTFIANKDWYGANATGAFTTSDVSSSIPGGLNSGAVAKYTLNASRSSSIYGNSSTVQPPAYVVNVWRRTK